MPSVGAKELLILELLAEGQKPMYGRELVRASDDRISQAAVYVQLARLEDKGLVKSRVEPPDASRSGIPRRLFVLTGLGARVLSGHEAMRSAFLRPSAAF